MRVADHIAQWLADKQITHAFGVIGGGNVCLFDAIAKAGKTQIVCCHHEQAAAMASTYFNRTLGKLASVVLVTTGAGSSNAITGVLAAYMDSIPLLVLSGNEDSKYMENPTRVLGVQGYLSSDVASKFCVYSAQVDDTFPVSNYLDGAYQTATSNRHGPSWVDICKDIANAQLEE